jgi:3-oxoacyl-ACP reductase-like protein
MDQSTRRGFLATAAVGAVGVGATAIAPSAQAAGPRPDTTSHVPKDAAGTLVAHVADVHGDTVTLMVGEREVVVHDADLVARLARAAF